MKNKHNIIRMIIVMKSICKCTHVRTYNTNTHKRNSYNDDMKNKQNIIRMIIVMKSNQNASTHMYVHTTQTQTHTNVIVIIMII